MKIDSGSLPPDANRVTDTPGTASAPSTERPASTRAGGGDAVRVSGDAQLAAEAARRLAATESSADVRADVVERAKAAVAKGEVGTDLDKLADRLIDGLLDD